MYRIIISYDLLIVLFLIYYIIFCYYYQHESGNASSCDQIIIHQIKTHFIGTDALNVPPVTVAIASGSTEPSSAHYRVEKLRGSCNRGLADVIKPPKCTRFLFFYKCNN